jgi:hypothetical protein
MSSTLVSTLKRKVRSVTTKSGTTAPRRPRAAKVDVTTAAPKLLLPPAPESSERSFTLVDKQDRSKLSEGRSAGYGFALCKYDPDGETLTTVQPFSPCKDYLSDVVYSEWVKKPYQACGLSTKYTGIFENGRAWLAFRVCGQGCGSTIENPVKYPGMEKDLKAIEDGRANAQKLINSIEILLKVPHLTRLYRVTTNCVVAKMDLYWVRWTYRVSLISLLLRNAFYYDGTTDAMAWLKKQSEQGQDAYMLKSAVTHMERAIKEGSFPDDDWERKSSYYDYAGKLQSYPISWHAAGICAWMWPEDLARKVAEQKEAAEKAKAAKAAGTPAPTTGLVTFTTAPLPAAAPATVAPKKG